YDGKPVTLPTGLTAKVVGSWGNATPHTAPRFLAYVVLGPSTTVIPHPPPLVSITSVSNNASGGAGIESGSWVSIYGSNMSATTRSWQASDFVGSLLPTTLDGVSVKINGKAATVYYISPGQVNVQ